ncbi:MAG: SH3 domain-containing protein [Clostridiales bacterium]|nr:SH3 domain-containing protein [Clostridiales bacterium]
MKKHIVDEELDREVEKRLLVRKFRRAFKVVTLVLVASLFALSFPVLSIGHASDICLQVPQEETLPDSNTQNTSSKVRFLDLKAEDAESASEIVKENTFMIIEQKDRDGMVMEMLDESSFTVVKDVMYAEDENVAIHVKPDNKSQVIYVAPSHAKLERESMGTSWSYVQYSIPESDETVKGYVFSGYLTSVPPEDEEMKEESVELTPTPTPETTNTPTPTVEPTPTFTPTPAPEYAYEGTFYSAGEVNIRSGPGTDYEVIGRLMENEKVEAAAKTENGWVKITSGGYVSGNLLVSEPVQPPVTATPTPTPEATSTPTPTPTEVPATPTPVEKENTPTPAPKKAEESEFYGTFYSVGEVNVRQGPGTDYDVLRKLSENDKVEVVAKTSDGWYKLSGGGYVSSELVLAEPNLPEATPTPAKAEPTPTPVQEKSEPTPTPEPKEPEDPTPTPTPKPTPKPVKLKDPSSCTLVEYARSFIGIPYVYENASPTDGFDCSGFVMYVYAHYYGISLPHQSALIAEMGTDVSGQSLKAGDVLCHDYNSDGRVDHVSLYCGNSVIVHASSSNGCIVEDCLPMGYTVTVRRFI